MSYNQDIILRGNYEVVEKVKPDPLNLSVNTGVGKQSIIQKYDLVRVLLNNEKHSFLFYTKLNIGNFAGKLQSS